MLEQEVYRGKLAVVVAVVGAAPLQSVAALEGEQNAVPVAATVAALYTAAPAVGIDLPAVQSHMVGGQTPAHVRADGPVHDQGGSMESPRWVWSVAKTAPGAHCQRSDRSNLARVENIAVVAVVLLGWGENPPG